MSHALATAAIDPVLDSARLDIAIGLPWRASLRLAPVLEDTALGSPEAALVAAKAASSWKGWTVVDQILADHTWVDTLFAAEGRALLARAALERGEDSLAVVHARLAVDGAAPGGGRWDHDGADGADGTGAGGARGERLVTLARAAERVEDFELAIRSYREAANRYPSIADWLLLRAAAASRDSAARSGIYRDLVNPVARERIVRVEARARAVSGDTAGSIDRHRSAGDLPAALELELAVARSQSESLAVRRELGSLLTSQSPRAAIPRAIEILDRGFHPLSKDEELTVARAAALVGMTGRAVSGYRRALAAGTGTSRDRYAFGNALARLGKYPEAAAQYERVTAPRSLAADAAYLAARSRLRGGLGGARDGLRAILRTYPDEQASARARILLSDLAIDEGRDEAARATYRAVASRHPSSRYTPLARFQAAMIAFVLGDHRTAALEFDTLAAKHPTSLESISSVYWAGRAWEAAGDSPAARERWRRVMEREPWSYYTFLSAKRLGERVALPSRPDSVPGSPVVANAIARIALLERLGLIPEAGFEEQALVESMPDSAVAVLAVAEGLRSIGKVARAIRVAWIAVDIRAPMDRRTLELLYPILHRDGIEALANEHGVEPALIAGLIRQESSFDPGATSRAGARGLMQIMPDLGRRLARSRSFPYCDPVLLYQPDVSLELGVSHLGELLGQAPELNHALAAYNAGRSRLDRWLARPGMEDPEIFAERIPFAETRGYVRAVRRNREVYRLLYAWETPSPSE